MAMVVVVVTTMGLVVVVVVTMTMMMMTIVINFELDETMGGHLLRPITNANANKKNCCAIHPTFENASKMVWS